MLSSVVNSERAIAVNILIMRAFVQLRRAEGQLSQLSDRIEDLAKQVDGHDQLFAEIFAALHALSQPPPVASPPSEVGLPADGRGSVRHCHIAQSSR